MKTAHQIPGGLVRILNGICAILIATLIAVALMPKSTQAMTGVPDKYQQLFDVGQYQPLVAQLNAAIAQKSAKTDAADRYVLLMFKGEALLHMKAVGAAEDAFNAAALDGQDANSISIAKATGNLIKHSGSSKYQPRTRDGDSSALPPAIGILDEASRKQAFAAFLTDLLSTISPQMENLDKITSLPPIVSLAKTAGDARDVEVAATGSDTQSKEVLEKLAKHAGSLMSAALKPLAGEITSIGKDAAKHQRMMGRRATQDQYGSLLPGDVSQLDNIITQAREVIDAAKQMQPIFGKIGDFKTIQSDAEKIITNANKLLTQYHHAAD